MKYTGTLSYIFFYLQNGGSRSTKFTSLHASFLAVNTEYPEPTQVSASRELWGRSLFNQHRTCLVLILLAVGLVSEVHHQIMYLLLRKQSLTINSDTEQVESKTHNKSNWCKQNINRKLIDNIYI